MQDLLRKFSLRELRLVALGLGTAMTIAIAAAFVFPNIKALRSASSLVSALEAELLKTGELDRRLQESRDRIADLKYRLYGDMANLPLRQVESFIIGQLQILSWDNDVELVSVRPSVGQEIRVFQETLFDVELNGRYHDLYRWLWQARNDLGFVVVKELNLRRSDDTDDDPVLLASLNLASYRMSE